MDNTSQQLLQGAAGVGGGAAKYVDEVFKSYVYRGTGGATQTITTGLDIAGDGGLVWIKNRTNTANPTLQDSLLGDNKYIVTSSANGSGTNTTRIKTITSTGFQVGDDGDTGGNNVDYVSWNFKKAEGFFDLVEYTGNGAAYQQISHELGSQPGCMMIKSISDTGDWRVWHRGITPNTATYGLTLNGNGATYGTMGDFASDNPDATQFTVGSTKNIDGVTYRCYLFAHDQALFGEDEDQSIIKCGNVTCPSQGIGVTVDLGWEPQYFLLKRTDGTQDWWITDNIRQYPACYQGNGPQNMVLRANTASQEQPETYNAFNNTGFTLWTLSTQSFIYIAIRRPDGKVGRPAEAGTDAFALDTGNSSSTIPTFDSGFPVDMSLYREVNGVADWILGSRQMINKYVTANENTAEGTNNDWTWDSNVGWCKSGGSNANYQSWMWKRGQGFDVVRWRGNGATSRIIKHGLGRVPEMIWTKNRSDSDNWICYHKGLNGGTTPQNYFIKINEGDQQSTDVGAWNNTAPTATQFTVGSADNMNYNGHNTIAWMFASVDGISKCGYYTGDGTSNNSLAITTGFTPRFVITKRTDGSSNWLVIDTLRGFTKYLRLSSTLAQSTQTFITATATGFTLSSSDSDINSSGGKYIYYAHA